MMIAEKTWKVPAALRVAIVAFATCVFPLGVVYAQDFEAVERRLGGAVEAGELSLQQANLMMESLRRSNSSREMEAKKRRYMQFAEEIEAAVEAGKLSKDDAEEKLIDMRREMFEDRGRGDRGRGDRGERDMEAKKRRYKEAAKRIQAKLDAGKVSKEDAKKRLIELRKKMFKQADSEDRDE